MMQSCNDISEEFSGFYDNSLNVEEKRKVAAHIATCPSCAAEYRSFARTLEVIRAIPAEQPTIDLWAEFAPIMEQVEADRKLGIGARAQRIWRQLLGGISEGAILYTTQLARRTNRRLAKYLTHDPFSAK